VTRSPEERLAVDIARRALPLAPVVVLVAGLIWGADGAWSALIAVVIVVCNLVFAALGLAWAARRSPAAVMAVAMGGFIVRMAVVVTIVALIQDEPWVDLTALAVTILVTQLGLLAWESRYVSASLAYPSLKPSPKEARSS
jgi:uncharacterized membrane protein